EPRVRSYNMSRIRGKDTQPELVVRRFLFSNGFRFRLHDGKMPGKPDVVLKKYRNVVFVHGCFWHGHDGCRNFVVPKTRTDWWLNKINQNRQKDRECTAALALLGWKVYIIWECELKRDKKEKTLTQLVSFLQNSWK